MNDDGLEPGTLWTHRYRPFRARIQCAAPRGVHVFLQPEPGEDPRIACRAGEAFALPDGRIAVPRATFREWFVRWRALISPEVRMLKSRFSMSLANLEHMHVFVVRAEAELLRFIARSADRPPEEARGARRGSPPVPREAIFVGTYQHPFPADLFLSDLDDVLAQLARETEAAPVAGNDAAAA